MTKYTEENYTETAFIDSPLVPVEENDRIDIRMLYPVLGFQNAESRCLLRKEAWDMLQNAAEKLPEGYRFRIWDAWRPFALQKELFISYSADVIRDFHLEGLPEEEQQESTPSAKRQFRTLFLAIFFLGFSVVLEALRFRVRLDAQTLTLARAGVVAGLSLAMITAVYGTWTSFRYGSTPKRRKHTG